MVLKFVRDQYAEAKFEKIYDANLDGWSSKDFHAKCDNKGWTLSIVQTTKNFIFGGFTTAYWESSPDPISKISPESFLFSVNEGKKFSIKYP